MSANLRVLAPPHCQFLKETPGMYVSVIYAADEFHINTPEHFAQVANNV